MTEDRTRLPEGWRMMINSPPPQLDWVLYRPNGTVVTFPINRKEGIEMAWAIEDKERAP